MAPGPKKSFDPEEALARARDLFWRDGYDGTGIRELEAELGIGRKSLYDTFGSKRELYLAALQLYSDTVIQRICRRLEDPSGGALSNLEHVLLRLQKHHASGASLGCLLGVAMGQVASEDDEVADVVRKALRRLECALERSVRRAQSDGDARKDLSAKDAARNLVALMQGMALMGRVHESAAHSRSVVRAALTGLRDPKAR